VCGGRGIVGVEQLFTVRLFLAHRMTTRREPLRGRALRRSSPGLVDFARIIVDITLWVFA